MPKIKQNNHIEIPPVPREAIADVRGEEDFVGLLRRVVERPIPMSVEWPADATSFSLRLCLPCETFGFCFTGASQRENIKAVRKSSADNIPEKT